MNKRKILRIVHRLYLYTYCIYLLYVFPSQILSNYRLQGVPWDSCTIPSKESWKGTINQNVTFCYLNPLKISINEKCWIFQNFCDSFLACIFYLSFQIETFREAFSNFIWKIPNISNLILLLENFASKTYNGYIDFLCVFKSFMWLLNFANTEKYCYFPAAFFLMMFSFFAIFYFYIALLTLQCICLWPC